ncbi:MAG: GNAT family N-acetyltransferase [Brachybacterium tyrofermentans]
MHGAATPSFDGGRRAVVMRGILTTRRLRLTPVGEDDLEELLALHADPRAFADDLTEPLTDREQMRWVLDRWIQAWQQHGTGYLTVRARAQAPAPAPAPIQQTGGAAIPSGLLGVVGLTHLEHEGEQSLSAYWRLTPAATGHGIATEAMAAVLTDPRLGGADHEVIAVTAEANRPSRSLAARLGFAPAPPGRAAPGGREGDILLIRPPGRTPPRTL